MWIYAILLSMKRYSFFFEKGFCCQNITDKDVWGSWYKSKADWRK